MRKLLLPLLAATLLGGSSALAATLDDPLHGMVCATGAASCNTDNGSFAPIVNLSNFGFSYSGTAGDNTGDLRLVVLAPAGDGFISPMVTGTNLLVPSPFALVGQWTLASNTDLAGFLGFPSSSPANPFNAFQVGVNTSVTAFNVFTLDIGNLTLNGLSSPLADAFFASGGTVPNGVDIVGFLLGTPAGTVSTAPSGQLQVTQLSTVPLPGAFFMFAPVIGFFGWLLRRLRLGTAQPSLA